jgi:hypothetical protein
LLTTLSAIDDKQHFRLALKVGTPDESSGIDQDPVAAFAANRIGDTFAAHSSPSPYESCLLGRASVLSSAQPQCNLILALGRI